jgi:hypothetical protein
VEKRLPRNHHVSHTTPPASEPEETRWNDFGTLEMAESNVLNVHPLALVMGCDSSDTFLKSYRDYCAQQEQYVMTLAGLDSCDPTSFATTVFHFLGVLITREHDLSVRCCFAEANV